MQVLILDIQQRGQNYALEKKNPKINNNPASSTNGAGKTAQLCAEE